MILRQIGCKQTANLIVCFLLVLVYKDEYKEILSFS